MLILISLLVIIQSLSASSFLELSPRIVGGNEINIERYPWQVGILYTGKLLCGGSIIGDRWILTAAHCSTHELDVLSVRVGSAHADEDGLIVKPQKIILHDYDANAHDYDIALWELSTPLNFTNKIKPVTLPNSDTDIADGTIATVTGWGSTGNEDQSTKKLRAVDVSIFNQTECINQWKHNVNVTNRMICTDVKDGKHSCSGDSGGSLVSFVTGEPQLIGVVSWGDSSCVNQKISHPAVYARVTYFRSWIKEKTGI